MLKWCPVANSQNVCVHSFDMAIGRVCITSKFHLDNKHTAEIQYRLPRVLLLFFFTNNIAECKLSCYWIYFVSIARSLDQCVHKYKSSWCIESVWREQMTAKTVLAQTKKKRLRLKIYPAKIVIEMACGLLWLNYETNNRYKMSTGSYQRVLFEMERCMFVFKFWDVHWFSGEIKC